MSELQVPRFQFRMATGSAAETRRLAKVLGTMVESPLVIAMSGDLGSGKTTFVQGLARGLDVPETYIVTSPTFTLVNEYPGRLPLYHVDLYRIEDPLDAEDFGLFEILGNGGVVVIEWAEHLGNELPAERLDIVFEMGSAETARSLAFRGYGSAAENLVNRMKSWSEELA
jgi:tRNA threonylcarbamoyladenosine biosynthesis protein TsaE